MSLLLKKIWEVGEISRADLARHYGLSRSTVSSIVTQLITTRLVDERGAGHSSGGRKPIILGFNRSAFGAIGVELGASHVCVTLTDLVGNVLMETQEELDVRVQAEQTISLANSLIRQCIAAAPKGMEGILGIGVGVPSPVHDDNLGKLSPQILPAWAGINLLERLEREHRCPVFMENDANLGALAEQWWGAGRDGGDLAYIKVATGIGSGHIIGGGIYRGSQGFAGEIGHTTIEPSDARFNYGMRGSLTSLVGTEALLERARALRGRHNETTLPTEPTIHDLIDAAASGDPLSVALVEEAGVYVGYAVANMLNLLNPSTVVVGGAITQVGENLLHPLRQTVRERTLWGSIGQCKIVRSELGPQAISIGAATLVIHDVLSNPHRLLQTTTLNMTGS